VKVTLSNGTIQVAGPKGRLERQLPRGVHPLIEDGKQGILRIYLKYDENNRGVVSLKRISKSSRRVYVDRLHIPRVLNGLGISILSTSKGMLTDREARKTNVGGEVVCYVW